MLQDVLKMLVVEMSWQFTACVLFVIGGFVIIAATMSVQRSVRRRDKRDAKIRLVAETRVANDTRLIDARSRPRGGDG